MSEPTKTAMSVMKVALTTMVVGRWLVDVTYILRIGNLLVKIGYLRILWIILQALAPQNVFDIYIYNVHLYIYEDTVGIKWAEPR